MDRKQKLEQISYKTNVKTVRNRDRYKFTKAEAMQNDPIYDDKAMFETLGDQLSNNIKGGMTYWREQYLELRAMAEHYGVPD